MCYNVTPATAPTLPLYAEPSEYTFISESSCAVRASSTKAQCDYKVTGLHWGVDVAEQLSEFEALKEVASREGGM